MTKPTQPSLINGISIHYGTSYDELCEYLKTPGPLAWASFRALSHLGTSVSLKKLIELSQSDDWRFRRSAVEAIAYHPYAGESVETIGKALSDPSEYVVRAACEVIAKLKFATLHDNVLYLLTSNNPKTREYAVKTLSEIWQMKDFDKVYSIFVTDKIQEVRNAAAWALHGHATNDNWLKLFEVWWQDSLVRHRKWSCELASAFGVSQVKKELEKLTFDKDGHVRKAAIKALNFLQT
ncbi:MAG: HEAT repeat domain-containing protein [Chloroflexota bacterium]